MMPAAAGGTVLWFARHEARLAWRDWISMMTAGRVRRRRTLILGGIGITIFLHAIAWAMLRDSPTLTGPVDRHVLASLTLLLLAGWSFMLSQAMESVTRAFYARGDLDLILTSPAPAARLFVVRIAAMAVSVTGLTLALGAPVINLAIWLGGWRWASLYLVAIALALSAVALAIMLTAWLFRLCGARRTRAITQVVSAVIGAVFAIGVQIAAIRSFGGDSGTAARAAVLEQWAPDPASVLWWPAYAAMGSPLALAGLAGGCLLLFAVATWVYAPRFAGFVLAAANAPAATRRAGGPVRAFWPSSPASALRGKEWRLLWRDPWLLSQTLMQLLYLLPAAFILWRGMRGEGGVPMLLVPVLIVAAGQLGGGLAWLAVSGEDAHDLIATAPVSAGRVLRAKAEAVLGCIVAVFLPFASMLALIDWFSAVTAMVGALIAAASSTAIQYWFRAQSRRSLFRRRQTSSRIATLAEALSSTGWAGTGATVVAGHWLALAPAAMVALVLAGCWLIRPRRLEG